VNKKYFSLEKNDKTATLSIHGDITSLPYYENDVSADNLSRQLEAMGDVDKIDVYINSYGGEVAEGLAIYNALKRHKAKVRTICDGFACSIASVIFMAGDERIMNEASLLMIHNAWTLAQGDSKALRKQADDLEKITQASIEAYKANSSLTEEEIKALMDDETWILPTEAVEYGFATSVISEKSENASQSVRETLFNIIMAAQNEQIAEEDDEDDKDDGEEETPDTSDSAGSDDGAEEEPEAADEEDEGESEDESDAEDNETAAQKWSGFFNAITKF